MATRARRHRSHETIRCWTEKFAPDSASIGPIIGEGTGRQGPAARRLQGQLLVTRLTCDCAFSLFGKITVSTPW